MNKITGACFLLSMVLLLHHVSAEHKKPDDKPTRIDNVDGDMIKPLHDILGELEGLRIRRAAQGGSGGQGGQGGGGSGNGGRRGPPDGGQGQRGGQGGQGSGEN
ncbi:uncharacterized protein LOC128709367 [Anopheles marshallii]|uniref:uncharacterized protein LOC128709367 n=1 Tax=Anopheles marshallii TaxID=1521116 RepID=UPI00237B685B|nr:uncharacterized protein LOC128709367 [Anopheles marshallii]